MYCICAAAAERVRHLGLADDSKQTPFPGLTAAFNILRVYNVFLFFSFLIQLFAMLSPSMLTSCCKEVKILQRAVTLSLQQSEEARLTDIHQWRGRGEGKTDGERDDQT